MPQPKAKRAKWNVLNPTPEERAIICGLAKDAGMGISAYLIERGLQRPVAGRQDWTRIAHQQARLIALLEQIADTPVPDAGLREAGQILLALRRIEAEIEGWVPTGQDEAPGGEA